MTERTLAAIEVEGLRAGYGDAVILHGVDLSIGAGEIVCLLGRNGVGRSTTLKAIMGDVDRKGSVRFRGEEMIGSPPHRIARKGLGYVPENRDVFTALTVRENLILGQKAGAQSTRWPMDEVFDLFPRLRERADTQAGVLSGGEQQRVAVARALANRPALVLADEPTGNLDERTADVVLAEFLRLVREEGSAALVATHNERLASRMDRVVRLQDGVLERPSGDGRG